MTPNLLQSSAAAALPHKALSRLPYSRSVAIVGASDARLRIGGRPTACMPERCFAGRLLPVNPNRANTQSLPAFGNVTALPEAPDVAVAAKLAPQVVAELARAACRPPWCYQLASPKWARRGCSSNTSWCPMPVPKACAC